MVLYQSDDKRAVSEGCRRASDVFPLYGGWVKYVDSHYNFLRKRNEAHVEFR